MSGSGKGLLGMWLYRRDEEWTIKEGSPLHRSRDVRDRMFNLYTFLKIKFEKKKN